MTEVLSTVSDKVLINSLQLMPKGQNRPSVRFVCVGFPFHKVAALTIWNGGGGARVLRQDRQVKHHLPCGPRARRAPRDRERPAGPLGLRHGGRGMRPRGLRSGCHPPSPPGPLRLVPYAWGRGGGGPRREPRPPGSTNFSASSSSILLLFFSLKERENKRRVSITLHIRLPR